MNIKKYLNDHGGFKQFLIRTTILFFLFVLIQLITQPFIQGITSPKVFDTVQYTILGGVLAFTFFVFILLIKERLDLFKSYKIKIKSFLLFFSLGIIFNFLFFYSKVIINNNLTIAIKFLVFFIILRYLLLALAILFFSLAVLGYGHIKSLVKNFKKELGISAMTTIILVIFSILIQNAWSFLSSTITTVEYFLLKLFFRDAIRYSNYDIGVNNFVVNIGKVCSGIESILLFTFLYLIIFFLDRKKINYKRMLLIYPLGLFGVFIVNIIRIFLLLLIGILYSPTIAVGVFHTNAGWILFIMYFGIFWYGVYKFVRK